MSYNPNNRPLQPAPPSSELKRASSSHGGDPDTDGEGDHKDGKRRRVKRNTGKACVYCRRSHMVCEGGRPCERCIKRDIAHLCRDVTPPPNHRHHSDHTSHRAESTVSPPHQPSQPLPSMPIDPNNNITTTTNSSSSDSRQAQLPSSLYSDPNFPPAWPLLPDTAGPVTYGNGSGSSAPGQAPQPWGTQDETELGALSKFLGDMGVPSLPGGFLDVLSYFSRGGANTNGAGNIPIPGVDPSSLNGNPNPTPDLLAMQQNTFGSSSNGSGVTSREASRQQSPGKGKEKASTVASQLAGVSRIERYFLAAADQPSGPRASRLAQVIKAKYDAGLLKPYDYIKGYERMNKWMDSGRAAPKAESIVGSAPNSPQKRSGRLPGGTPIPAYGSSISPESRRRILAALNGFRPKFRQIARTLTDVDLVFVEEAMERWMLEYDRAFASIHTPSCIWRRTCEIQKANQEFSNLTGIPASMFRNGQLCVYELMDEESAVRYWEGYAKIAFDAGQRSLYTHCTLKIPLSLTRHRPPPTFTPASVPRTNIPDLALPQPLVQGDAMDSGSLGPVGLGAKEEYREIRCCFSVTIRRDAWGVPVAIMGQWIPI